jgi:multicomponent Na+:H+ antiporter subunit D
VVRVWVRVFWGAEKEPLPDPDPTDELVVGTARASRPMYAATVALIAVSIAIVVAAGPLSAITEQAGSDLLARTPYIEAVLG